MTPEQKYQHLKELAEKLDIAVSEQNLRTAGIPVKSGFCKVKGEKRFIIDKHLTRHRKIKILAEFLGQLPVDGIYILPKVRELLQKKT